MAAAGQPDAVRAHTEAREHQRDAQLPSECRARCVSEQYGRMRRCLSPWARSRRTLDNDARAARTDASRWMEREDEARRRRRRALRRTCLWPARAGLHLLVEARQACEDEETRLQLPVPLAHFPCACVPGLPCLRVR